MTVLLDAPAPAAALLAAADADLDALGDRLHDGVLQALVVARYACDVAARGGDAALARDAVQDALVALRREVWLLRPRGDAGLAPALRDLDAQLTAAGRPGLRVDLDEPTAAALAPETAAAAYRLVQALLSDTPLPVRLDRVGGRARLVVGAALPDPSAWALRAGALGGELHADADSTLLLLPIPEDHP